MKRQINWTLMACIAIFTGEATLVEGSATGAVKPLRSVQFYQQEEGMKPGYTIALSLLAGVAIGAAAVAAVHAQAKPPAYVVAEIDVMNVEPFDKEYVPPAAKAITDGGGKYLVRGGETAAFYGEPPKPRIAVMVFESMEKAQAAFNSSAYKEAKKVGDQYAKFRVYAVEGVSQ